MKHIEYCHTCGSEIPADTFCYRLDERFYCPRCVQEAACYLSEEDMDPFDSFAAHWEVESVRYIGGCTEKTIRQKKQSEQYPKAADTRKGET